MSASTEKKLRQAAREAGTDKKAIAAQREAEKKAKSRRRWTLGTVAVVIFVALILFLNSGFIYKHTAAVTIGDESYSPAEVNYHYANEFFTVANQYGSYAGLMGLDTSTGVAGLKEQPCPMLEDGGTWRDYLLDAALTGMVQTKAVADYAAAKGISLSEEELAEVEFELSNFDFYAQMQGYSNADNFLGANYGNGVNMKVATAAAHEAALVNKTVVGYADALEYTAEELSEKYESYNGDKDYYDIAYYYLMAETVEGEDGSSAATEETVAKAQAQADAILESYNAQEGEDIEARLNAALGEAGLEMECTRSRSLGSGLGSYKDWVMSGPEIGEAAVIPNTTGDAFYIVAYGGHDDNDYALAQVRHILVMAQADENGAFTEEAKAAALTRAEELYEEWKSGEATEESFAAMAELHSEDGGSNTNGGLYDDVQKGQMVEEFDQFCFEGHKKGDTAIVYGESSGYAGYHIMYYVGEGENCRDHIARTELENEDTTAWMEELVAPYEAVEKFWLRFAA